VVLLRCAQEGLANVRKHASASKASVLLAADDHAVTLTVRDDGIGPSDEAIGIENGFGLNGMRDRVGLVAGSVEFGASEDGSGAVLRVRLPLPEAGAA
jgi:signal transduction histidine kinase